MLVLEADMVVASVPSGQGGSDMPSFQRGYPGVVPP